MQLTLYSRPGCHLCDEMRYQLKTLVPDLELAIVDIEADPQLEQRFGIRIPVLCQNEDIIAEGRLDEADFLDFLAGIAKKAP
ncbi:MAG: glutaredoxin family protein [Gammaproteobacteria bacterium]|nr:glutaredoxin family protein [Gammaproteobacteria bacterium]